MKMNGKRPLFLPALVLPLLLAASSQASFLHAPHDEAHGLSCKSCHEYPLDAGVWPPGFPPASPNGDDTLRNFICLRCHDGAVNDPSELPAPAVSMHSSLVRRGTEGWTNECVACHDPHFQSQLDYAATDADRLYLAGGTIVRVIPDAETTSFAYRLDGAVSPSWQDPASWPAKTGSGRGLHVVIDTGEDLKVFEIVSTQTSPEATITVRGRFDAVMADKPFGVIYGQLIRDLVQTPAGTRKPVRFFDAATLFTDQAGAPLPGGPVDLRPNQPQPEGLCQVCHTATKYYKPDHLGHFQEPCRNCHQHGTGFGHAGSGATGAGCDSCHGHDSGWGGNSQLGKGTFQSHSTHTENDADDARGPMLACDACHDIARFPAFKSGTDTNGDGRISLAETDVCNPCHSPDGPFDGVNDPAVGAKANWKRGIYNGNSLAVGKEKWCLTCHDSGTSVIPAGSTYKPRDFAGNDATYGYFVSGHGGKAIGCDGCHDLGASHNFDGKRTYKASLNNYRQGYRLKLMPDGGEPFRIPVARNMQVNDGCNYQRDDFRLCYSCHAEQALLGNVMSDGTYECQIPAPLASQTTITTGFRNVSTAGDNGGPGDVPANIHWDHLVDVHSVFMMVSFWDSDQDGTNDTRATCVTCHNPHGPAGNQTNQSGQPLPTYKMTIKSLDIVAGQDANGSYGQFGPAMNTSRCFMCHFGPGGKYYRDAVPAFSSLTVSDRSTPKTAEIDYTNERAVKVQLDVTTVDPAEMRIAEQMFTDDTTGWMPLPRTTMYPIRTTEYVMTSPGDGTKNIYAQVRNATGKSVVLNKSIILDTSAPVVPANALITPNGGENWKVGTTQVIRYTQLAGSDGAAGNLATCPITLEFSTDGGVTYPYNLGYAYCLWLTENNWVVTNNPSQTAKFRLTVTDKAGNVGRDFSDANFIIAP